MQMPSTPWSIMQSKTRRWLSRSRSPLSRKGVGAIGTTPLSGVSLRDGIAGPLLMFVVVSVDRHVVITLAPLGREGDHVPRRRCQAQRDFAAVAFHTFERRRLDAVGGRLAVDRAQVVMTKLDGVGHGQVAEAARLDGNRH